MAEILLLQTDENTLTPKLAAKLLQKVGMQQNKAAFGRLYVYFAPRIKAYMFSLGCHESDAEDLTQKTMMQIWRKAALFDPCKAAASTWIFRIARNQRIDALRKDSKLSREELDFDTIPDDSSNAEYELDRIQHANHIRKAIKFLNEDQSRIIHLSFYEGLSHSMISEKLNIPLGTVKSRMRLAFSKLKLHLEDSLND